MKTDRITIAPKGIKRTLKNYDFMRAIDEYIWNGFDAGANEVRIDWQFNELSGIDRLLITDNGSGIDYDALNEKFTPFFETGKSKDDTKSHIGNSLIHGRNGYGRLTFFHFASIARWSTIYTKAESTLKYCITINEETLDEWAAGDVETTSDDTGTVVEFREIHDVKLDDLDVELGKHLALEFAWYLELFSSGIKQIIINDQPLDYGWLIGDKEDFDETINGKHFEIRYRRWEEKTFDEFSRFYYFNLQNIHIGNEYTRTNQKGDSFYNSIYIRSEFFDNPLHIVSPKEKDDAGQISFSEADKAHNEIKNELVERLRKYLSQKRRPFLRQKAVTYVSNIRQDSFPTFGNNPWDSARCEYLGKVIEEVYVTDPGIFSGLNKKQAKTLISLFNLIIDSDEKEALFDIIQSIVNLDSEERNELASLLKKTELSNITATIKFIVDRLAAIEQLGKLVFDEDCHANEVKHLQKFIESHYWIFGEQYNLVASAEDNFEKVVRQYHHILTGETTTKKLDHSDKQKQMDILAVRNIKSAEHIENIVVELKHPKLKIDGKHLNQVKNYLRIITEIPEFNDGAMRWVFYLVGKDYNNEIAMEIESNRNHGERNLVMNANNRKIYVFKWSEIITGVKLRHEFLLEKLKLRMGNVNADLCSADQIINNIEDNTAALPHTVISM